MMYIPRLFLNTNLSIPGFTADEMRKFRESQKRLSEIMRSGKEPSKIDYKEIVARYDRKVRPLSVSEIYAARNKRTLNVFAACPLCSKPGKCLTNTLSAG